MPAYLFYLFALVTIGFGLLVVVARNPVTSALSLAASFVGLAALFIGLDAYFIGTIQVLVYAGAVMVLFLFIIMLMDIKDEQSKTANTPAVAGGVFVAVMLVLQTFMVLKHFGGQDALPPIDTAAAVSTAPGAKLPTIANDLRAGTVPDAKLMGFALFKHYSFHLQVIGLLLLVGTVGVIALSKREKIATQEEQ